MSVSERVAKLTALIDGIRGEMLAYPSSSTERRTLLEAAAVLLRQKAAVMGRKQKERVKC